MKMHVLLLSSLVMATAAAQTWTFPMDPRAAYLRTNNDTPTAPLVLDLATLGIAPGQWLHLETTGAYRYINGGTDSYRSLVGVFSSSTTLLGTNVLQRVVDAIAAGPAVVSGPTFFGQLPIDIPQDFDASRFGYGNGIDVRVPAGANYLFLGTHDSLYNDNVDPNGDFGAVVSIAQAPSLAGTGEHITLRSTVTGNPVAWPDTHPTPAGATMTAELQYPLGLIDGSIYVLLAETVPTGSPAPNPLPGLWSANLLVVRVGILPATAGFTDSWSLVAPPGFAGTTLLVQGGALSSLARNGLFETTAAHRFVLQ